MRTTAQRQACVKHISISAGPFQGSCTYPSTRRFTRVLRLKEVFCWHFEGVCFSFASRLRDTKLIVTRILT